MSIGRIAETRARAQAEKIRRLEADLAAANQRAESLEGALRNEQEQWRVERERAETAERERDALLAERRMGRTPNFCHNDECGTTAYGVGYSRCPGCGGTDGHVEGPSS